MAGVLKYLAHKLKNAFDTRAVPSVDGVSLSLPSFPIAANYGPETRKELRGLIKEAQGGGPEDIYQLGLKAFGLGNDAYLYTEPFAITTRRNAFKLINAMAQEGHEDSMNFAAYLMVSAQGTKQDIAGARSLWTKLSRSPNEAARQQGQDNLQLLETNVASGHVVVHTHELGSFDPKTGQSGVPQYYSDHKGFTSCKP
jgi:hypothetical protein